MRPFLIHKAQECLIVREGHHQRKIFNLEPLFAQHDPEQVIQILKRLSEKYQVKLTGLALIDKSNPEIDVLLARMFRIFMTIRVIEEDLMEDMAA
jgi:hypothetical protein